MPRTTLNVASK